MLSTTPFTRWQKTRLATLQDLQVSTRDTSSKKAEMRPFSSRQHTRESFLCKGFSFFLSIYIFYLQQSACLLLVFNIIFTKTRSIMYTSPTMDGAWLIIVSLKWFSLPQPNQRIPYIFGITLIQEAQSDKTPISDALFFEIELRKKPFTLHLFLGIPCVYRGFRG